MRSLTCAEPLLCAAALQRDACVDQRDRLRHQALGERADEVLWGRRQPRQHCGVELKAHAAAPSCWVGAGLGLREQRLGCLVKAPAGKSRGVRIRSVTAISRDCSIPIATLIQTGLQQAKVGA